jgi:hypothetical protein
MRSDAAVLVGDSEPIHVHKLILSARSPVFATMFRSGMSEAKTGQVRDNLATTNSACLPHEFSLFKRYQVVIDDIEPAVVRAMLR